MQIQTLGPRSLTGSRFDAGSLSLAGAGHLRQVRAGPLLRGGGAERQGVRGTAVLEKRGGRTGDDRGLRRRRVGLLSPLRVAPGNILQSVASSARSRSREGKRPAWTEEEEEELRKLYEEHRRSDGLSRLSSLFFAGALAARLDLTLRASPRPVPDVVETLLPLLSNGNRTRRQVVTQLVHMGLVGNAKELKKAKYVFYSW